jgi:hypothetical protein
MPNPTLRSNLRRLRSLWSRTPGAKPFLGFVSDYTSAINRGRDAVRQPRFPSRAATLRQVRV